MPGRFHIPQTIGSPYTYTSGRNAHWKVIVYRAAVLVKYLSNAREEERDEGAD
jgi:hypothetical protein